MVASIAGRDGLGMTTISSTATSPRPAVVAAGNVAAFGEDADGELYVLSLSGQVSRVVAEPR